MKNLRRLAIVFLCLVLTLSCCSSALALGDTLRWGVYSAPNGLFLAGVYQTMYDRYVIELTSDTLFLEDESAESETYLPALAEKWDISEDGTVYTFYLRQDVNWQDGEKFDADDLVFDIVSQCDGRLNSSGYVSMWSYIVGAQEYYDYTAALGNGETPETVVETVTGVQKIDDYTVSITLKNVFAPFMNSMSTFYLYAEHVWAPIPVETWRTCDQIAKPVGTGPYKFVEYVTDQYVTLEANEDYYLGAPKIKNFVYKIVNQDTAQVELINGDLDVVSMISNPTEETMNTYADNNCNVIEFADAGYQYMIFNTQLPKLSNPVVRQAITTAINRQGIVDSLLNGHGVVPDCPIYYNSWAIPDDLNPYTYDPAAAKELLASAGVTDTDGDGYVEYDGEIFTVEIICPIGNKVREQSAVVIQQNLEAIGIKVDLETMEFNTLMDRAIYSYNYELCLIGLSINTDPNSIYTSYCSENQFVPGNNNSSAWALPELDELMDAGVQTADTAERQAIYYQIAHILNENLPECWLYTANEIRATRPELQNYQVTNSYEFLNVQDWYFAE